jgi:hypothetical protein
MGVFEEPAGTGAEFGPGGSPGTGQDRKEYRPDQVGDQLIDGRRRRGDQRPRRRGR